MGDHSKHILLSSMGTSGARETKYTWQEQTKKSGFSAFGLWQLLPEENRPDEIWFLLTPLAREKSWSNVQEEAQKLNIKVNSIEIPGESKTDDTTQFLEIAAQAIPEGSHLTLDITQGLRHHAFLFYALSLYLSQFHDVTIEGAYYCRMETSNRDDPKPVIDLKPTIELAHWFHALAVFRETGSLRVLATLVDDSKMKESLQKFSSLFSIGMPIEAASQASQLLKQLEQTTSALSNLPLADKIWKNLQKEIEPFSGQHIENKKKTAVILKEDLPLTKEELTRQATYIDHYFKTDQLNLAFGLMREWVVNWIIQFNFKKELWLNHKTARQPAEHLLGGLGALIKDTKNPARKEMTPHQKEWANLWNDLCDIRNALQHHGMKVKLFKAEKNKIIERLKCKWKKRENWDTSPLSQGDGHKLLITPLGNAPGVLYSALNHIHPDRCLVVCSEDSQQSLDDAIEKAEWEGEVELLKMNNPFTGIDEFSSLKNQAGRWLFQADEIHASLTGGTTLMGVLVGRLVSLSKRQYQRSVREFVLIDKRQPDQQRDDPWQLGEIHYLDGEPNQRENNNVDKNKDEEITL